jgi:hypothetical protein
LMGARFKGCAYDMELIFQFAEVLILGHYLVAQC